MATATELAQQATQSLTQPEEVTGTKCHVRTFVYEDGHTEELHEHDGIDMIVLTDAFGTSVYTTSPLVEVRDTVHYG